MAQFKKPQVRAAILQSAGRLFSRKGYTATSLFEIARGAGVSSANMYNYFHSNLEILYALYDPWVKKRFDRMEADMALVKGPRNKFRVLLLTLWRDMPT